MESLDRFKLRFLNALAISLCLIAIAGCGREDSEPINVWFSEEASERGIAYVHSSGSEGEYLLPEIMAGGSGLLDVEGDGDLDLYFVQSGKSVGPMNTQGNELYLNDGTGYFTRITKSGAEDTNYGMGLAVADVDLNGFADIFITNVGRNTLLLNHGGTFVDETTSAGITGSEFSSAASFGDFDNDGDFDLFVVNYVHWTRNTEIKCFDLDTGARNYCDPSNYRRPTRDQLFRNNGDSTFTDVTAKSGIGTKFGNGLGSVVADFNADGLLDIAVANDKTLNHLWLNRGSLTFDEVGLLWGMAMDDQGIAKAGMGIAAPDFDSDGDEDLIVVNIQGETDSYFENDRIFFSVATAAVGLTRESRGFTRFGIAVSDFDNDGLLDVYEANGRVNISMESQVEDVYAEPNMLFAGVEETAVTLTNEKLFSDSVRIHTSRAVSQGDLNNDGQQDLLVSNRDAAPYLLINQSSSSHHWIQLKLVDENRRTALGASVSITNDGLFRFARVATDGSYLSAHSDVLHFGLGNLSTPLMAEVTWLDGTREIFFDLEVDRLHLLQKQQGNAPSE